MSEVIQASPGLPAWRREATVPLSGIVSTLVLCTTGMSLLALATLLPSVLSMVLLGIFVAMSAYSRYRKIPALVRLALFLGMAGFIATQGMGFRSEAGTALLMASMIIKQSETRTSRDASTMLLFNVIAPFTAMLQNQDPVVMGLSLVALFFGLCAALAHSESAQNGTHKIMLRTLVLLVAVAPFSVLMYLVVPRLDSPMWMGARSTGKTGVSETMNVGAWQRIMNDYSTAFRVHYEGKPPTGTQYYRGYVLWTFNGTTWERGAVDTLADTLSPPLGDPSRIWANYQINYEDKSLQRLFLLDYPTADIPGVRFIQSGESFWEGIARNRVSASAGHPLPQTLTPAQRRSALEVPPESSPRLRQLVARLREKYPNDMEFAQAALAQFKDFQYTLEPRRLDPDQPIDAFVFDFKEGFCIHFSSAYAIMLRLAGIPSRVVNGYASSELSELGNYYRVRQADAHAWVEAWIDGRWIRFDPTNQSIASREEAMSWGASWRNSGYEMSDWFKSYWDKWIAFYDAGAQEKTIEAAQEKISSALEAVQAAPKKVMLWLLGFVGLSMAWTYLASLLRAPSVLGLLSRWEAWLDQNVPPTYPGQPLADRLDSIPWLSKVERQTGKEHLNTLQKMAFDPTHPKVPRATRRNMNRITSRIFAQWGRMKKNFKASDTND